MADLSITGEVVVTSEKAEGAFDRVGAKAGQMASKVQTEANKASSAIDGIGTGAETGAEKFTRAESRMRAAIQKSTRELEMLGKTASQKFEAQLEFKGLDKAKFQPFLSELRKAEEATKRAETGINSMSATAQIAGRAMALAFSGAAITGFLGKVVSVQREFDVLNSSLKTVTGSSAAAEREMAWLKDFAKETPFGLAQATQGFVKMKALGLDPTRAALTSFGNTASAMGKDLNQMIEAVADASTGEFERLKEFGIKAKKEGDNVSLTFQGVTTTIKNSAAEITQYLENIGNVSFGGAMEERAKTLDGTIAALGDTWDELFRTVSTNNVGGLIFDSVTLANGALEDATTILRALGGAAQDAGRDTGALSTIQSGIATVFETVAVLGANLKFVLVGIGNEIGGLAAQVAQAAQFNFSGVAAIRRQMVADAEAARKEIDATTARILNARKAQEEYARYATRNASAATDPRRVDLGGSTPRATGGVSSGTAKAVKETISEYDKLIKKLSDELPKAAAEAEAAQMGYNKSQTEFLALAGSPVWASFTNSQRAVVASMFEGKIASEQAGDAVKELSKAYADAAAERIKTIQSMERAADGLQSQNDALREEIELIGLSAEQQTLVLQQRNDVLILTKEATLAELERQSAITGTQTRVEIALAAEIAALKERNELLGAKAGKNAAQDLEKANADAAKKAQEDWERASEQINNTLTDALMRGFESGKDFAKNLRDTVVNMFKTMVLRPVISAIVNPVAGAITGAMGLPGAAQAGQGGNAASTAMSAASMFGAGGLGGSLAAGAGWLTGATTLGGSLSAATSLIAAPGGLMSGLGMMAGALGPIAIGIAALSSLIKKSTPHTGGIGAYSAASGATTGSSVGLAFGIDQKHYTQAGEDLSTNVAKSIVGILDATATTFGKQAGYYAATAFADDSSKDGAWGALRIKFGEKVLLDWADTTVRDANVPREFADGEAGQKQYLAAVAASARDALVQAIGDVGWANDMLTALGESPTLEGLAVTVQQINAAQAAFVGFGQYMPAFASLADSAVSKIVQASGGVDALAGSMSVFVDGFYTDAEKLAVNTGNVREAMGKLGFELPATRDEFKALVQSQIALGDAGAQTTAGLLAMSGAVSAVLPPFEEAAAGVETAIGTVSDAMKRLQSDTAGLQIELLRAQGNTTGANAAQRTLDTTGFTEAEVALYDYNQALRTQIDTLNQAAEAAAQQAEAAAQQAEIRAGLERQLLELQGDTAALRLLDIAGMADYNVALYDQVQAATEKNRQDDIKKGLDRQILELTKDTAALRALEIDGMSEANVALYDRVQLLQDEARIAQERNGLMTSLYQALGNTGALRAQQLAELDPSNQGLQQQIWQIEDAKSSLEKALQAEAESANAAKQAAQERVNTLQSIFDMLKSNVQDLYETATDATKQLGAAQGNAFIDNALRNARATGYMPESEDLQDAISGARGGLDKEYATEFEKQRDALVLAGKLAELQDISGGQLTAAERQLKAAEAQVEALDSMQAQGRNMLDRLSGNVTATISVRDAINNLAAAITGVDPGAAGGALGSESAYTGSPEEDEARGVFGGVRPSIINAAVAGAGIDPAAQALAALKAAYGGGMDARLYDKYVSGAGFENTLVDVPGYADWLLETGKVNEDWLRRAGIPGFAVGTNYVPRDMLAQIHEGEAIVPKAYNPAAGGTQNNARLEALIEGLTSRVQALQSELVAIKTNTANMAANIDEVTEGGNAMRSRAVGVTA